MISEDETSELDFDFVYYVGHVVLGYTDREVGRMTLRRIMKMYQFYKDQHDFEASGGNYRKAEIAAARQGLWF